MNHAALIDVYNQIVANKHDVTVMTELFDQLCEISLRDYPVTQPHMQSELNALFDKKITCLPDYSNVTPALVPIMIIKCIVASDKLNIRTSQCTQWTKFVLTHMDIIMNYKPS